MIGELFVGIACQSFGWLISAVQIGFDQWPPRRQRAKRKEGASFGPPALATQPAARV